MISRSNTCTGPRQSLITGELYCSADVMHNWPEDGDWERFCTECREGYDAHIDQQIDQREEG